MSTDTVQCAICGEKMRTIHWKHLMKHNISLFDYKIQYPNYPIKSDLAIQRKSESAKAANSTRKGVKRTLETIQKIKDTKKANPKEAWNKGIARTVEQNKHLSETRKDRFNSGLIKHWNKGNICPTSVKLKISDTALAQQRTYGDDSKYKRQQTIEQKIAAGWVHHSTTQFMGKLTVDGFEKFNNKDWLYTQHITNKRTIASMCVELGLHWKNSSKTIRDKLIYYDIPIQYWHQSSSAQQVDLETFLTGLNVQIIIKNRQLITPYELDIYLPEHNIAIEYCGLYWHSSEYKSNNYHNMKYDMCNNIGVRLITIYSDEWLNNRQLVENKLQSILGIRTSIKLHGRKCNIIRPNTADKTYFFNNYHIQGNGPGSINIGLEYNNELVACMSFIKQKGEIFILNRYATSSQVVGGFSKLLSHFKKNYEWKQIISFADLRWSQGDVYNNNGFVLDKILPPDYSYVVGEERIHKFNYRHKNLKKKLEKYDPTLSETQNTLNNQIYKIYNCGLQRWIQYNN